MWFILVLLFVNYCSILHTNHCKPAFAPPCILSVNNIFYLHCFLSFFSLWYFKGLGLSNLDSETSLNKSIMPYHIIYVCVRSCNPHTRICFFQREGQGQGERERETSMGERNIHQLPLVCALNWGPNLKPRHVP